MVFSGSLQFGRRQTRMILTALCLGQLALSASVLLYIHDRQIILGEFGATWGAQQHLPQQ
jgi:hypothetical protein